jgi:hypothetical protein
MLFSTLEGRDCGATWQAYKRLPNEAKLNEPAHGLRGSTEQALINFKLMFYPSFCHEILPNGRKFPAFPHNTFVAHMAARFAISAKLRETHRTKYIQLFQLLG